MNHTLQAISSAIHENFWSNIWKIDVVPKCANLVWRQAQYSASSQYLIRKGMDLDPTCPMCGVDYMKKLLNLHIPF